MLFLFFEKTNLKIFSSSYKKAIMPTPNELYLYLQRRGYVHRPGNHAGYFRGRGHRHGFYTESGSMVVNQITLTEDPNYNPPPCYSGYLNMKNFRIQDLTAEEISKINKSKTLAIKGNITFARLVELLDILDSY